MTVAELIEKLRELPPDAQVLCEPLRDPYERFYPSTVEHADGTVTLSTDAMPWELCDLCHRRETRCGECERGYCEPCGFPSACPHIRAPR